MASANFAEAQKIASARLDRGKAAWEALKLAGGIWPPCSFDPPQVGIWDGMGEYDSDVVQKIVRDALPKIAAERAWPWVARAIFIYETERVIRDSYAPPEPNADLLIDQIRSHSDALWKSLIAVNFLTIKSPEEVGKPHFDKAGKVYNALRMHFVGPTSVGDEYSHFLEDLKAVSEVCAGYSGNVARDRRRGASDPHLSLLVWELADFWRQATRRNPSAADPARKDGKHGPFVRLVNGCLSISEVPNASPKQVANAIKHPPTFAAKSI